MKIYNIYWYDCHGIRSLQDTTSDLDRWLEENNKERKGNFNYESDCDGTVSEDGTWDICKSEDECRCHEEKLSDFEIEETTVDISLEKNYEITIKDLKKNGIQNINKLFEDVQEDLFTNNDIIHELIKDYVKTYDVNDFMFWLKLQEKNIEDYKEEN